VSTILLLAGLLGVFASIFVALTAIGVFTNEAQGVSKSLAVIEAFSAAPQELRKDLEPGFDERILTPLLDRSLKLGKKLTPADHADRIRHKLEVAGNPRGLTVDRVTSLKFVGFVAALVVGLVVTMLFGFGLLTTLGICMLLAVVGYMSPNFYLYQLAYDRGQLLLTALPDALDLLTISVESGLGFDAALSQVARNTEGPLSEEFARVLQEMQIGMGRLEALRALGERSNLSDLRSFVTAMVQADSFGIPIANVLRVQSAEMRVKRRQRAEETAQKIPVKILFPLIFFMLPALFIVVAGPGVIQIMNTLL